MGLAFVRIVRCDGFHYFLGLATGFIALSCAVSDLRCLGMHFFWFLICHFGSLFRKV